MCLCVARVTLHMHGDQGQPAGVHSLLTPHGPAVELRLGSENCTHTILPKMVSFSKPYFLNRTEPS